MSQADYRSHDVKAPVQDPTAEPCPDCGEMISPEDKTEHADFHFAKTLQDQEQPAPQSSQPPPVPMASHPPPQSHDTKDHKDEKSAPPGSFAPPPDAPPAYLPPAKAQPTSFSQHVPNHTNIVMEAQKIRAKDEVSVPCQGLANVRILTFDSVVFRTRCRTCSTSTVSTIQTSSQNTIATTTAIAPSTSTRP